MPNVLMVVSLEQSQTLMPDVLMAGTLVCYVSLEQSQTLIPNVRMSGTPVCYVCLGQSQTFMPNVLMSGTLVMFLLDRARPICQMEEEEESGEAKKEGTR